MIRLDPFGLEGMPVIAALYGAAFADDWPEQAIKSLLATPNTHALIASFLRERGPAEPAGFVLYRVVVDEAEVLSIGVRPDRRRQGVAATLLTGVHQRVGTSGAASVFLEVGVDNPAAIALYESHLYARVGMRPGYYRRADGQRVNALIMKRDLSRSTSK